MVKKRKKKSSKGLKRPAQVVKTKPAEEDHKVLAENAAKADTNSVFQCIELETRQIGSNGRGISFSNFRFSIIISCFKFRMISESKMQISDYSPDFQYYMSDITRMIPVNGKFSKEQVQLYGFYLKCYRAILDKIRPNIEPVKVRREASDEMKKILKNSKFSKSHHRKAAENFVNGYARSSNRDYASLGHGVGMATHDVGDHSKMLVPGMVFTIEPALRVPEENIYIRLEDLIVITETGAEVVSDFVPMDIKGIEKLMREKGMLDQYKPLTKKDYLKYLNKK